MKACAEYRFDKNAIPVLTWAARLSLLPGPAP